MKMTSKMKIPRKIKITSKSVPSHLKKYHLDSHGTTDIKLEMLSGVQTRNGIQHVEYNICGIAHVHTYIICVSLQ